MNTLTLTLLHPPRELSPNASKPLTMRGASIAAKKKASVVKKARDHAHVMTLFTLKGVKMKPSTYALTWYYKGRKPDEDNCIAWIKAYMDGACRAMGIDDKDLHLADIQRVHDLERAGFLTITFEEE